MPSKSCDREPEIVGVDQGSFGESADSLADSFPVLGGQPAVSHPMGVDASFTAEHAFSQFLGRHLQRGDEDRSLGVEGDMRRSAQNERGLTERRPSTDYIQGARAKAAEQIVQVFVAR